MWTEFCLAERNSAHVLVSARISRLLDTCLSVIHNANYIVNSIVCAVILVRGSRVPAYGIRPMHGQIHIVNMHGTGTNHIVRHSQKSVVQWSVISKFACIMKQGTYPHHEHTHGLTYENTCTKLSKATFWKWLNKSCFSCWILKRFSLMQFLRRYVLIC